MNTEESENQLEVNEGYLDFALKSHQLGAWSLNLENHSARRTLIHDQIFGYPTLLPTWTFEMFLDHVVPEDRPEVLQSFQTAMAAQSNWSFNCRIRRVDGAIRHILAEGTHRKDATGKAVEIQGLVQDITERKRGEEVQQQMAALVESADDAILTKSLDGIVRSWNPGAARLLGYSADEIIGQHITRLLPHDRQDEESMILHKVREGEHVSHFETVRRRRDGSLVDVSLTISPIRDRAGNVVGASKIMRDISQRKLADERFRLVVEAAPNAMLMTDKDRRITLVNRSTEALFGYTRAELIGQPLELLVPQRFRDHHPELVANFFAAPQARAMGAGRELFGLRKDGSEVPIEIGLNPIETPQGLFTLASIIDITERKRADERFRLVVEAAPNAMLMADRDRRITLVNRNAEALFGYSREELMGQPLELLVPQRFRDRHPELVADFFTAPRARAMGAGRELFGLRKDGSEVPIEIGLNPIETSLGVYTLASIIDITERKRIENELRRNNAELEQMNKELDDFVYTASHDLRSPLNGVSTVVQWILQDDGALAAESRNRLALIQGRIERMKRLLNDIRDYARAGQPAELKGTPLTAAELVADVAATSDVPTGFSLRCDPSLGDVFVNRVPLEQVLHNLISNAIKHHDRETGIVTVSVESDGPHLRFSVIDDGPGVPDAYREAVFEMFKTLKPRDEVEGSGMGLALVRKIVGRLGGKCGIEEAQGRGAKVWFDWPRSAQPLGRGK
jgi:PAS domain S-box-containing protein